jgi:muramidase (phage lysozyme)
MSRDLPLNQIRPAAQPLSTFIQPAQRQVAAPAGPLEIPRVPQINLIQQGSGGSIAGANNFARTAAALAPFNQQLTQLVGAGLVLYAKQQDQVGTAEAANAAMRAKALLDEQVAQSGAEYAAENRKLSVQDPIAALMMDQVNPFRAAARQRKLTELAAAEVPAAMLTAYRNMEGAYMLAPGDPKLAQLKADVTQGLVQKYQLDESSPGFAQKFLPQLNQASDKITELQWKDRQDYLKDSTWRTAQAQLLGIYGTALRDGIEFNGERITPDQGSRFRTAVIAAWTLTLDGLADELGIAGEVIPMKVKAIEGALALAESAGNTELRDLLRQISVGPPDKFGQRPNAMFYMTSEALDAEIKYGEVFYKRQQREQESLGQAYQDELINKTYNLPDGPARLLAIEELREDKRFEALPLSQKLELEQSTSTTIDKVTDLGRSTDGVAALLLDMDGRVGTQWSASQADAEFEAALAGAPEDQRPALRQQYAAIRRRNNDREASPTSRDVSNVIELRIKANARAAYPNNVTEAAIREQSVQQLMAGLTDADAKASVQRQFSAYQPFVRQRIAQAEGEKGAPLTNAEAVAVATKALDEYGSRDPKQKQYLFPGVDGQPGVAGSQPQQQGAAAGSGAQRQGPPPGTRPASRPVYPSGQLDNIPDRQSRVRSWRSEPVLDAQSVVTEANRILYEGGKPSAALQRFAKDAGTTPGALLNKHIDYYPGGIRVTPEERERLQRDGRRAQATRSAAQPKQVAARSPQDSPVARAAGWMLDMVMGTRPAVAAQPRLRSAVGVGGGGGGQVAMRSGGISSGGVYTAAPGLSPQQRALLRTIRWAEGTAGPDGYRTMFTGAKFSDLSRHPRRINSSNGLSSDAAGAYQFLSTTWDSVGGGAMTPARQDMAALELVRRRGVDPRLPGGFTLQVADRLAPEWASFPTAKTGTSYYGQGGKSFAQLKAYYDRALQEEMGR